jgi:hypothetical protein
MSAALGLRRLQRVDSEIDRIQAGLDAIAGALKDGAALSRALAGVEEARQAQEEAQRVLRLAEEAAAAQQAKIKQAEASLYGGSSHSPKELQELQEDVGSLKRYLATLEERELEIMAQVETIENQLKAAEGELHSARTSSGQEHDRLHSEQEALAKEMRRLQDERRATVGAVAREHLLAYEELRPKKHGLAVAEIRDDACAACGTTLTAAMQQTARSASVVVHCPTCGRILYAT